MKTVWLGLRLLILGGYLTACAPEPTPPRPDPNRMIPIPRAEQTFIGCAPNDTHCAPDEGLSELRRPVQLDAFWIDAAEVTARAYQACVQQGWCTPAGTGAKCSAGDPNRADWPINCVTWTQARQYCHAQNKMLPTEAQWGYAARTLPQDIYPWGSLPPPSSTHAVYGQPSSASPSPIASRPPGSRELYDMAGNVWEWTKDCYHSSPYWTRKNPELIENQPFAERRLPLRNPAYTPRTCPSQTRSLRGGGFLSSAEDMRVSNRGYAPENHVSADVGFRCVRLQTSETSLEPQVSMGPDMGPPQPTMVKIPHGPFWMGCASADKNCAPDELPRRKVNVETFWIDTTEVTVADYRACIDAEVCPEPALHRTSCRIARTYEDQHPVNCVSAEEAEKYCRFVGKRLATEVEWEKAARGPNDHIYPWGNTQPTLEQAAFFAPPQRAVIDHVAQRPPGPHALYDMAGNVEEWTSDCFGARPSTARSRKNCPLSKRVVRGGSASDRVEGLRLSKRSERGPLCGWTCGFRCASSTQPSTW